MSTMPSVAALLSGSIFGAALTAASVYSPVVILDQLALKDLHMLKVFLTASACSAVIVYAANKLGIATLPFRRNTTLGLFGPYDANVVGGLLQGLGMALTGACPGTVFVQVALGNRQAVKVLAGGVLGGLAFVYVVQPVFAPKDGSSKHTVQERLKVSGETALLGYEGMMVGMIAAVDRLGLGSSGTRYPIQPVYGGMLIGLAQASSVLLSKKTLGVSSAFAQLAEHVKRLTTSSASPTGWANILFAIGVMGGAKIASQRVALLPASTVELSTAAAVLGGFSGILGARIAGGCTSGHGISGMSTLSVSSFVTVAAMFGGGIVFKHVLDAM